MSITVNTNVSAMTAQRYLNSATSDVNQSMERLSSGSKINSAKDDAAGLQISNRLNTQTRGLDVAVRNANDGISMMQTAEGAMKETSNILSRVRDLALQSSNGSNTDADRGAIQQEVTALSDEMNRIAETTSFGGTRLLNGNFGTKSFQVGADSGEAVMLTLNNLRADEANMGGQSFTAKEGVAAGWTAGKDANMTISFTDKSGEDQSVSINAKAGDDIEEVATYINGQTDKVSASVGEDGKLQVFAAKGTIEGEIAFSGALANETGMSDAVQAQKTVGNIDVTTVAGSQDAVAVVDAAMKFVDSHRSELGAAQNRMGHTINNLDNINENVSSAKSQIKDVDFAKETTEMTKAQILQQASSSILAQAKQAPNAALGLLR
ncbi:MULTISPECIES: flagellin [Aliivibrio]|jgi:flagellin|uniref:Flagellin n=3 Tax=Aliivibrio TaxID=511678 RepID=A0A1B9P271_ALILO|nr:MULTISPECIES: flagellin [Aliivibrio]AZL85465.1 flagellin [Aliivibrio salmonicida]MBB1315227.1 flagellin [Aliivibrio sp. SR45-2]OCH22452.1 flagellin [Aliivibrio logei]OEF19789.1 flagellin [Aliivibrio logei 5S-186]CAQ80001.1 flagellin subunit E [Aliivibrio salmonicida LFI1238]